LAPSMTNISDTLGQVGELFVRLSETPQLDAQVLLAHVFQKPRTWILAHPETHLTVAQVDSVKQAVSRLRHGEPLPYILGHQEFFGLDFELTPDVLIPRPETELLVERAIAKMETATQPQSVADIGTGSGCIAISLAVHVPELQIVATDISPQALAVAHRNARRFHVEHQIEFIECDLLPSSQVDLPSSPFDLICANLPYIPTQTLHQLPVYGREPTLALDGGSDGLDLVRRLLALAPEWLASGGCLLLEIESTLGAPALSWAYDSFSEAEIHLHRDLTGRDRLLEIQLSKVRSE
jgi:release factor glutamine methyltransferase